MTSEGTDKTKIANHKTAIRTILDTYTEFLNTNEVNDGVNEADNPTLAVNVDFNNATQANKFNQELQNYITNNSADFLNARIRIHDCFHAAGESLPCAIGDVWQL